ncbi:MAG: (2Fe-2S) ferredoxin domain-containing protein [Anaerolineae bacterium]
MPEEVSARRQRIVVCRGQYCNLSRRADKLLKRLEPLLDEANGDQYPRPIKLEIANCLSMCGAGPNIIVYPENAVYNGVDDTVLDSLICRHLKGDIP